MKISLFLPLAIFQLFLIPISEQGQTKMQKFNKLKMRIKTKICSRNKDPESLSVSSSSENEKEKAKEKEKEIKEFIGKFVNPLAKELKCKKILDLKKGEMEAEENDHKMAICKQILEIQKIKGMGRKFVAKFKEIVLEDLHNFHFYIDGKSWVGKRKEDANRIEEYGRNGIIKIQPLKEIIKNSMPFLIMRLEEQSRMDPSKAKPQPNVFPLSPEALAKLGLAQLAFNISVALKNLKGQCCMDLQRILAIFIVDLHVYAAEVEEIWKSGILQKWDWARESPEFFGTAPKKMEEKMKENGKN